MILMNLTLIGEFNTAAGAKFRASRESLTQSLACAYTIYCGYYVRQKISEKLSKNFKKIIDILNIVCYHIKAVSFDSDVFLMNVAVAA